MVLSSKECLFVDVLPLLIQWSGDSFLGRRAARQCLVKESVAQLQCRYISVEGVESQMEGSMGLSTSRCLALLSSTGFVLRGRPVKGKKQCEKAIMVMFHTQERQERQYNAFKTSGDLADASMKLRRIIPSDFSR